MKIVGKVCLGVVLVLVAGCSNAPGTGPTGEGLGTKATTGGLRTETGTCLSENIRGFEVNTSGHTVTLLWTPYVNATSYVVDIEKANGTPVRSWTPEKLGGPSGKLSVDWYLGEEGTYRARVRAKTSCGSDSSWSDFLLFNIDSFGGSHDSPAPPPPVTTPTTPVVENPGDNPEGNPSDNPGGQDGRGGRGDNPGGNPGGPGGRHGGPPPPPPPPHDDHRHGHGRGRL